MNDIAWSGDGEFLASASDDKTVVLWSMEQVRVPLFAPLWFNSPCQGDVAKTLLGHTNFVFCVNFNPRSNLLVSGGYDETVRVWDVARGMVCLHVFICVTNHLAGQSLKVLPAHSDPVTSVGFSHDGTLIVSCAMDGLM